MKLDFEHIQEVGNGSYPDLLHFANTQGQIFSIINGNLLGVPTNPIDGGEWDDVVFQDGFDISPDLDMKNFELKIMLGWGAIGCYRTGNSHKMLIYEFNEIDYRNYIKYLDHIEIRNQDGNKTAYLSPQTDGVKDCYLDTRLNGESTLEFLLPATSPKIDELTPECTLYAGWKAYMLRKDDAIDFVRDDKNRLWAKVMAHERWYELGTSYVEPSISNDPTAKPPADLAVIIVGAGSNLTEDRYVVGTAAHALYAILEGSDWHLGICDVEGIHDLEAEKESRLALIKMVQDIWGGYLVFDSVNKVIHLRDPNKWQPYNGFQIRYRKNLKHITRTQSNRIITKLYPFGHDDLDIALVNNGEKFIVNKNYTSREYVGIYKNQDIYNQQELLERAKAELEIMCRPRYLYKVKIVDLRTLPEYSHEYFTLGDMADVIDPDIAPDSPRPRIIRHRYNLFQPWKCELDIGDPEERLIEQLKASFNTTEFVDGKFNNDGEFSGHSLEDLTVTGDKIGNLAITAEKIDDLAIQSYHIADLAITSAKIDDLAITADKINDLAITSDKIDNLTITGDKIANLTIDNTKIKNLSADKITAGVITATVELQAAKITSGSTITGAIIRTDESPNRRIELNSDGITAYSNDIIRHGFSLDSWGALNLYNNSALIGSMLYDTNGRGVPSEAKNRMFITTYNGYAMKLEASGNMSLEGNKIWLLGDVHLPRNTYIGNTELDYYIRSIVEEYIQ